MRKDLRNNMAKSMVTITPGCNVLKELVGYTFGKVQIGNDTSIDNWYIRADKTVENVTISRDVRFDDDTYYIGKEYVSQIVPRIVEILEGRSKKLL